MSVLLVKMQLAINCLAVRKTILNSVIACNGFHSRSISNTNSPKPCAASYVPVADFYNGKSVLVTGATGFLGMVLVEKLLYTCTGIEKVFLLVREKKGVPPDKRLQKFLNDPLFQRLKEDKPNFVSKLVPVTGDINSPDLGIKDEDVKTLSEQVSVVFHSAASVRFNDKMGSILNTNLGGTERILNLSKKMKNIEAFVHMSTAFANVTKEKDPAREALYPQPATFEEVKEFIAKYNNDDKMTEKFLNGRANTYTFTKALTEHYLYQNKGHVPVAIVRPSAVTAIAEGPVPGWLNDWQGVSRIIHNVALGHNRVVPGRPANIIDFIPVDYVANFSIIVAAQMNRSCHLPIYNCSSSATNPLTWKDAFDMYIEDTVKRGRNDLPLPHTFFTNSNVVMWLLTTVLQILPAYIADMYLRITGKEPRFMQIQKRVLSVRNAMDFFMRYSWIMENSNMMSLINSLSEEDQKLFPCNPADINWRNYMHMYSQGVDKFLIKGRSRI